MATISAEKVKKDNSNIRKHSDSLWRELRKLRFKKACPDVFTNEMAGEEFCLRVNPNSDFAVDVERFIGSYLNEREAKIFRLYVFGGKVRQVDIGDILGVSQSTVTNSIRKSLELFKDFYWPELVSKIVKEVCAEGGTCDK